MSPYSYITFAQAQTQLLERLGDPDGVYWLQAEAAIYIKEALRTWQALTSCWKDRFQFPLTAGTAWYDLTDQDNTLIPYTVEDTDLISEMLYQLIEPQLNAGVYVGSEMFSQDDFVQALQRRRDQFLLETGMVTSRTVITPLPSPPINKIPLADNVIDVRRAAWSNTQNVLSTLWRSDEWAASSFAPKWETAPTEPPIEFSTAAGPPLTLFLIPPPLNGGKIELISVNDGEVLDPDLTSSVLMGVPDDFAWVVKFGALADLLSNEGEASDPQRAEYCNARWKEGIALARIHTSVVTSYINGTKVFPVPIKELDQYRPSWQNGIGVPDMVGVMSWNMIAVALTPDSVAPYSVQLDVVQNAPMPVDGTSQLQVSREELDAILGYAQHVASWKQGGDEFMATVPLYKNFIELAKVRNERLRAAIPFYDPMMDRASKEEFENPRRQGSDGSAVQQEV